MRVLIVSHAHPAFSIGGAEVASHALFRALAAMPGVEAHYLARTGHPVARHAAGPLMSLRQGPREVFAHLDGYDHEWLSTRQLEDLDGPIADWLRDLAPDVVHVHHLIGYGAELLALLRRVLPQAVICVTFHEYLPICLNHGQMVKTQRNRLCHSASPAECSACKPAWTPEQVARRERFLKDHLALADRYVSPSRFLADRFVAWGLPRDRFAVIENGLADSPAAAPRPLPKGGRRARFGFFGQVTEFKGLQVVLDAIARVPDAVWGEDAALAVFGGNLEHQPEAFRTRFEALLQAAGRRARFHGAYRPEELPRLMAQVDWVVMPSIWWENSPVVIQEAFHHRRPVICSDIGGMAEKVRDRVDGLHFRTGSAEDLADRLAEALTDRALWPRLSAGCPVPPGAADCAAAHLDLYAGALRARGGAVAPRPARRRRVSPGLSGAGHAAAPHRPARRPGDRAGRPA
ncbi:glycosyltransferase family 4 protein [Paracraurococcus ruber]|uniref:Glycosyl transferase n=1 Tax=Paracraurococcus ruber TaxID=77675 RepID=A0ABS1CV04_9PROT|nr:glycosyltransferase family 4 protein [Paracraurococcus ruber]MBK1658343.1 glycosyl transferase [Paracraurococcus ruber]TDG16398.1 glycosyltransferase [Paracraurococcus ruber]